MSKVDQIDADRYTRLFINSVVDYAIILLDIEGNVSQWNSGAERLKGYTSDEIIGSNLSRFYTPQDREAGLPQKLLALAERDDHVEHTGWRVRKDGTLFWGDVVITAIRDGDGTLLGFGKVTRDLTERKISEEREHELAFSLDRANRLKSEFLANMSHEVRTPLNGIIGMLTLLLETPLADNQRDFAQTAKSSSDALLRIVNDILDFSKIEAGKLELEHAPFSPVAVLREVRDLFEPHARSKYLQLRLNVDDAVPAYLVGDPGRLRQVLTNLIGNALKFTSEGSVVVSMVANDVTGDKADVTFEVSDTGIGIANVNQRGLFDAFSQADSSTTRRYGGTGLGLSISQQLVGLMGSQIYVESTPGRGSTFGFQLHLSVARPGEVTGDDIAQNTVIESVRAKADGKILIVEDNEVNQKVAVSFVKYLGYECDVAVNGLEALNAIEKSTYTAIFMDCQMPVMDGFEASRRIRLLSGPKSRTPIIAITASALPEERAKCLSVGMDDFIAKPITPEAVANSLQSLVGKGTRHR